MNPVEQGYDDQRFQNVVDDNFHCPICMNILKEPVQCRRNEHYYCTPCITRHLRETSQTCPICMEVLTVETLKEPSRMVTNCLSPLKINCDFASRGCRQVVELGLLKTHVKNCEFSPVACSIDGCLMMVNKRDVQHHETQVCEFRKLKCDDCGKEVQYKKYKTHGCVLSKEMDKIKMNQAEMKDQFMSAQENMMKEIRGMMTEMKDEIKKLTKQVTVGLPRGDIMVAGGNDGTSHLNSAEIFSWRTRTWVPLPSMKQRHSSPSSFVCQDGIIVNGGYNGKSNTDCMEGMNMNQEDKEWFAYPAKLPFKCSGHATVVHQESLIVTGGYDGNKGKASNGIYKVLIKPPYTIKSVCPMKQPRCAHGAVVYNDKVLIVGGKTTIYHKDSVASVVLYDVNENKINEMPPLPFEVCNMATVCHGDSLVVMGGWDKEGKALNKVVMYNIETGEWQMLPSMKVKRAGCVAVVTGNTIVVMGGWDEDGECLNSVECFRLDQQVWEELPPMKEPRAGATAVVKPIV